MTGAVAQAIAWLVGSVLKVDRSVSKECIGRFLRVKVCFNVNEQLMRGTHVQFPDEGMIWVDFKYEGLPNYCLICGLIGHLSRICKGSVEGTDVVMEGEKNGGDLYAFKDLDAMTDLRGNLLHSGSRKGAGSGDSKRRRSSRRQQQSGETQSFKVKSVGRISSMSGNLGSNFQGSY